MTRKRRVGVDKWTMDDMAWLVKKLRTPLSKGRSQSDQLIIDFPLLQHDASADKWVIYGAGFTTDIGDYMEPVIVHWDDVESTVTEFESGGARLRYLWGYPCFDDERHSIMVYRTVLGFFLLETSARYFDASYQPTDRISKLTRKAINNRALAKVQGHVESTKFLTV